MPRARSFPPDSPVFNRITAGINGRRTDGSRDDEHGDSLHNLEVKHNALLDLRNELLELVDRDETRLDLVLRRADNESLRDIANDLGLDPSTILRRERAERFHLHTGIVARLSRLLLKFEGGGTLSTLSARAFIPQHEAYAIALQGHGEQFDHLPTEQEVAYWVRREWDTLRVSHVTIAHESLPVFVGVWNDCDGHRWHVDVSVVVQSKSKAFEIAWQNNQEAIYDLLNGQPIRVSRREK